MKMDLGIVKKMWSVAGVLGLLNIGTSAVSNTSDATGKMLYDFTKVTSLDGWEESSDTVREAGMSKASFVLQKTQVFQTSIFFSMLNPQPNGAGFAGYYRNESWNLTGFSAFQIQVRGQGDNYHYKIVLRHKGQPVFGGTYSYESFFQIPKNEWTVLQLPFSGFEAYHRGKLVPDAEPLDISDITSFGIQIVGGVYSTYKQTGASSLEINYIQSVQV